MRLLIAGDFCPQKRIAKLFEEGSYSYVLGAVQSYIKDADYSIVNFECPVCLGAEKPIVKCGPNLKCSEMGMEAVKWVGFNCVTLANNHFLDYGKEGVEHTFNACEKYCIDTVGGGMNLQEASKILYKVINGKTLAVINCCEHEFSIAAEKTAGSNPLNPIQQYYAIQQAKTMADYVLLIVHGGNEYYQLPSPRMQEVYRFFVDAGADAVINHHQHCFSGYEVYKKKPIFYGLGNFCFDNSLSGKTWNEGYMVELSFSDSITFNIIPYTQCGINPTIELINDKEKDIFFSTVNDLNIIIGNEKELDKHYTNYLASNSIASIFEPYSNSLLTRLKHKHLLPSFVSKEKKRLLLAHIQCESHISKILYFLKNDSL